MKYHSSVIENENLYENIIDIARYKEAIFELHIWKETYLTLIITLTTLNEIKIEDSIDNDIDLRKSIRNLLDLRKECLADIYDYRTEILLPYTPEKLDHINKNVIREIRKIRKIQRCELSLRISSLYIKSKLNYKLKMLNTILNSIAILMHAIDLNTDKSVSLPHVLGQLVLHRLFNIFMGYTDN